jgi:hypothetical protein
MKKLFLLLSIVSVIFASCSKNQDLDLPASQSNLKTGKWEVYSTAPTVTTSSPYVTFTDALFKIDFDPSNGASHQAGWGTRVYPILGGTKYRATLVLKDNLNAGITISAPGATYTYPATKTTQIQWTSGNCTIAGSGSCNYSLPAYCYYSLTIERYIP